MDINQYLDTAKTALRCRTDQELAARFGVGQSRLTNYRQGRFLPNIEMARTIARVLNIPPRIFVTEIRREKALREERRRLRVRPT